MRSLALATAVIFGAGTLALAQADRGLLNLVPAGTRVLAGIQVDQGKVSQFGQYLLQRAARQDSHLQQLMDATGFDPRRDLQEILFASAAEHSGETRSHGLVLARGVFDPQRVKAAVVAKGGRVESYQGFDILSGKQGDDGAMVFLDRTLAVLGDRIAVQKATEHRSVPSTLDPNLESRMNAVSTGNEAWFASIVPGSDLPAHASVDAGGQNINGAVLRSVIQSSGGVHFAADALNIRFDATTRSEKDAQSLADVIRFMASMAQTQAQDRNDIALIAPSLSSMQLTASGSATHVALSIPEKTVEQILSQSSMSHHQ